MTYILYGAILILETRKQQNERGTEMMRARETYKNMSVTAFENDGIFEIKVTVNGRITGTYKTTDKADAMAMYADARDEMLNR